MVDLRLTIDLYSNDIRKHFLIDQLKYDVFELNSFLHSKSMMNHKFSLYVSIELHGMVSSIHDKRIDHSHLYLNRIETHYFFA